MEYQKPIPLKNRDNQHYWDGADNHELIVQKCNRCQCYSHPAGPSCAQCGSPEMIWENLGRDISGHVYSYVISYRPYLLGFQDELPLVIALVEVDQAPGLKIMANVLQCSHEEVTIGMPVEMIWVDITEERALPQWKPFV